MWLFKASLCVLLGFFSGLSAALFLDVPVVIDIAKWSVGIFAFLWTILLGFITKVSDVTDVPGINYEEHRRLDFIVKNKIKKLWRLARFNIFLAFVSLPLIASVNKPFFALPLLIGGIGAIVGFALFCVLLYEHWIEELRQFRSDIKETERLAKARDTLLSQIEKKPSHSLSEGVKLDNYIKEIDQ